ncbi:DUF3881 family protein [bacterium 1XD42-8]|nr:DUF3881 family protein [Lachnospiraceae bacterium]RKJ35329.1 DUF3881 family protein [bacterium 1XD42-8]
MHKYLRAIGFSNIKKRKDLIELIKMVVSSPTNKNYVTKDENIIQVEICKEFTSSVGMSICGEYDENDVFNYEYSYPFIKGTTISSREDISIERHGDKESYAGICDDIKIGVSLIFYLQNMIDYLKEQSQGKLPINNTSLTLSGLSIQGSIILPVIKNEKQVKKYKQAAINRNHLIAAARRGDEEAIESLTLEDIDTYTVLSKKILKEDVFSLVDTYFMPYGIECDKYSILGEIEACYLQKNSVTEEEIYVLTINCNDLIFDVGINKKDLWGEPKPGRRFKGIVWLQGYINFPN